VEGHFEDSLQSPVLGEEETQSPSGEAQHEPRKAAPRDAAVYGPHPVYALYGAPSRLDHDTMKRHQVTHNAELHDYSSFSEIHGPGTLPVYLNGGNTQADRTNTLYANALGLRGAVLTDDEMRLHQLGAKFATSMTRSQAKEFAEFCARYKAMILNDRTRAERIPTSHATFRRVYIDGACSIPLKTPTPRVKVFGGCAVADLSDIVAILNASETASTWQQVHLNPERSPDPTRASVATSPVGQKIAEQLGATTMDLAWTTGPFVVKLIAAWGDDLGLQQYRKGAASVFVWQIYFPGYGYAIIYPPIYQHAAM
jgi:hypothetical protein